MQSPRRTAGLSGSELAEGLGAQRAVELQILLFCLALEALALLKLFPGRAALVAAMLIIGTGILTGQHNMTPLNWYSAGTQAP